MPVEVTTLRDSHPTVDAWFEREGWTAFDFQRACWSAYLEGRSGLLHAPTGNGKTLAAWLGPAIERLCDTEGGDPADPADAIRVLWLTPLRALANDTARALRESAESLGLPWTVDLRTGDTSSSAKAKQRQRLPTALVTTPESLTILLSYADSARKLRSVRCIVVDEWHELMGTKRGVQTELALARLRQIAPRVRTWGLSATLGNIDEAARVLTGTEGEAPAIVRGAVPKRVEVETLLPDEIERYPWTGHIGVKLADKVIEAIERAGTTLLFTNTRSQAEIWFRTLIRARPDLIGSIALHHGSLDRGIRTEVEAMLRAGGGAVSRLRCVVSTSSLDLGVDFSPVDQVIQVGSPKGIARLIQRAGRSGHRPGAVSRILCVPSHAFELVEFASARDGVASESVESRAPVRKPLDVLAQHLVTRALGGGFDEPELLAEARSTHAYRDLSDEEWGWVMDFARRGGPSLEAYPEYARIVLDDGQVVDRETGEVMETGDAGPGRWTVASRRIANRHRMGIGTIVADAGLRVQFQSGRTLGTIEESFITRLRPGDRFVFAGRVLELIRVREMTAYVKRATRVRGTVPRWNGGKMPLSSQLATAVRRRIALADEGVYEGPEMEAIRPLLERQKLASRLPRPDELLIERIETRDGHHAFLYPFAGRLAHEGLGAMLSLRLSRNRPGSFRAVVTDYGIELFSEEAFGVDEAGWRALLDAGGLVEDLLESMNATQLARRHFREIARIAGLTHQGYPGEVRPARHLQASSEMFFDVFEQFDPGNMLLTQAKREVLEGQLEFRRIGEALDAISAMRIVIVEPGELTPLSFPLWAESLRATTVSSESWEQRVRKMVVALEKGATK